MTVIVCYPGDIVRTFSNCTQAGVNNFITQVSEFGDRFGEVRITIKVR